METKRIRRQQVQARKKEEICALLAEYEQKKSEMTIPEFCELHGFGKSTFYTWQRKYSGGYQVKTRRGKFIEVMPTGTMPKAPVEQVFASIRSGNIEVELRQYVEPGYLRTLLS